MFTMARRLSCLKVSPALAVHQNPSIRRFLCPGNQASNLEVLSHVTKVAVFRVEKSSIYTLSKQVDSFWFNKGDIQLHSTISNVVPSNTNRSIFLHAEICQILPSRPKGTFFAKSNTAASMWKAATGVSNQGRQRGRAKGIIKIKNLNRGQRLGVGKSRISFPGLSTYASDKDKKKMPIGKIDAEVHQKYVDGVAEIQSMARMGIRKRRKISPLERGWSGNNPQGRKFGPPIATNPELTFDNFDSVLISYGTLITMTGVFGRTRNLRLIMVTGNKNGTAGFALIRSPTGRGPYTFQRAVNRAGLRLCHIPRYEDRTVYHDFFSNFGNTRLLVQQKPPGHGVKAHRVVKSICELIGIKDLHVEVEGATRNYINICKAFFLGLLRQRTHQELANEKRLYLVEFREENNNFPKVVASPEDGYVRTKQEIEPNEILDFEMIAFDGNRPRFKPKPTPFYERLPSWEQRLKKVKPQEHHFQHRIDMLVEHGREQSHLTDVFPECKSLTDQSAEYWRKKKQKDI